MKDTAISVTHAARNFADCVNRVHYQQVTYVLLRNGQPYARLVPAGARTCTGKRLAEVVAEHALPAAEAKAWQKDRRTAHKSLKSQADKWR